MAILSAIHPDWGLVDITREDLGCGRSWGELHAKGERARLACKVCDHGVAARLLRTHGTRYLAHLPDGPDCALKSEESRQHLHLKAALVDAVERIGWSAEPEVPGPGRRWVADVMATSPDGFRVALEAQCAPMTAEEGQERTQACRADGVERLWFSPNSARDWLQWVPSMVVRGSGPHSEGWTTRGLQLYLPGLVASHRLAEGLELCLTMVRLGTPDLPTITRPEPAAREAPLLESDGAARDLPEENALLGREKGPGAADRAGIDALVAYSVAIEAKYPQTRVYCGTHREAERQCDHGRVPHWRPE